MTPAVVIRPILLASVFGEPEVAVRAGRDAVGPLPAVGIGNSVMTPAVVIRPIWLPTLSVNQRLPSGPAAIRLGSLPAVGSGNSVIDAGRRDPADLVAGAFGEPEAAIRAGRDPDGHAVGRRDRKFGGDLTTRDAGQAPPEESQDQRPQSVRAMASS